MENIIFEACKKYDITREEFFSKSRKTEIVEPRQICHYLAYRSTNLSYAKIGKIIGNKDHATVLNSVRRVEALIYSDMFFAARVNFIKCNANISFINKEKRTDILIKEHREIQRKNHKKI